MFIKSSSGVSSHAKLHTYQEGYLLPVLSAKELIFSSRHKGLFRQIQDLSGLAQSEFDDIYDSLIRHFMEFTQVLPHKQGGVLGSLLNNGLARAAATYIKYCDARPNASALYKFAVFSASLLRELGLVMSNQRVVLVNENGDFVENWNPFTGSMIGRAPCFKMYRVGPKFMRIESEVTLLLARQVMSPDLFHWLSNDFAIFSDWVAALLDHEGSGAEEIGWALSIVKREDILAILNGLDGAQIEAQLPVATEYGEAFYQWLKEEIEKGNIPVNTDDANVHHLHEGVLLEKQLFKRFVDVMNAPVNFMVVYAQFGNLVCIVQTSGDDFLHAKYFSKGTSGARATAFTSSLSQQNQSKNVREGVVVSARDIFVGKNVAEKSDHLQASKAIIAANQRVLQKNVTVQLTPFEKGGR